MPGEAEWVTLAVLRRARGLRGELTGDSMDTDRERFADLERVTLISPAGETKPVTLLRVRPHQDRLLFEFEEIADRTAAERYEGWDVCIAREDRPEPPQGQYYLSDLVGFDVLDAGGKPLGQVGGWEDYGAGPLLVMEYEGREVMIPFVEPVRVSVDPAARQIVVDPPEGLLEL